MSARALPSLLQRPSSGGLWLTTVALVFAVGVLDYWSGYEVSFVLFYSAPILLMVWFADRTAAIFIALLCATVWWWADEASGHHYSEAWYQVWETVVRLVYFLLFVGGGTAVKSRIALLEHSQNLEQEIIGVSEREKQNIGRDLHDGVCQYFAAIGCAAGSLKRSLDKQGVPQADRAGEIEELIMKGVVQTRGIARGLFPVEDDAAGLQAALQELAARSSRLLNLQCTFECDSPAPIFDNVCATHLYRIVQESISNASRHANARTATIRLSANPHEVALTVADDGAGLPPEESRHRGLGLSIMRYRARLIDAQFEIGSRPGGGTLIRCFFAQNA